MLLLRSDSQQCAAIIVHCVQSTNQKERFAMLRDMASLATAQSTKPFKPYQERALAALVRQVGPERVIERVWEIKERAIKPAKSREKARMIRPCFLAALYQVRCSKEKVSLRTFARNLDRVVAVRYAYNSTFDRPGGGFKENKNAVALEQDVRRGLKAGDKRLIAEFMYGLIWFRIASRDHDCHLIGANPMNVRMVVRNKQKLLDWIDACIAELGWPHDDLRAHFEDKFQQNQFC
jgi:hypothetical protein